MPKVQTRKKIIAGLSGGVDSSAAALALKEQGHEVMGVYLRLHQEYSRGERAARRIATRLGLKFYPVNASYQFEEEVVDYFTHSYDLGLTPNPCVRCNQAVKFSVMFRLLEELGADYMATGHYSRIAYRGSPIADKESGAGEYGLYRGLDKEKDQSYFLYTLDQERLARLIFPLGELEKKEVREKADKAGLEYTQSESQDVCFLVKEGRIIDHKEFLKKRLDMKPGPIKALGGKKIGQHQGLPLYTLGQRKGVEIGGTGPYYVAKKDFAANTLYVTSDYDDPALFTGEFEIGRVNWIAGEEPKLPLDCEVVIRYRHPAAACRVQKRGEKYRVELKNPERAVTPGQSAVFYDQDKVLGGGTIL